MEHCHPLTYYDTIANAYQDIDIILIKFLRIKQHISQKYLAEKIGMSQSQIARLENLDVMPTLSTLQKYASGLGFTISLSVVPA